MVGVILYCIFCYLYEIGSVGARYLDKNEFCFFKLLYAPIIVPVELGFSVYYVVRKIRRL